MASRFSRFSTGLAALAVVAMTASPAMARGWGHHRHRHNHVSTGDVFAGIFVLGTIAAVASAAGKADRDRADPPRRQRYRDTRYDDRYDDRQDEGRVGSGGIGSAVNACADEVERADRRIASVDGVVREGEGWRVQGRVGNGKTFACSVSDTGRIRSVTVDGQAAYSGDDAEGSDEG